MHLQHTGVHVVFEGNIELTSVVDCIRLLKRSSFFVFADSETRFQTHCDCLCCLVVYFCLMLFHLLEFNLLLLGLPLLMAGKACLGQPRSACWVNYLFIFAMIFVLFIVAIRFTFYSLFGEFYVHLYWLVF